MLGWGIGEWACPNGDVRRSVQHVQRVKHGDDDDNDTLDALLILTSIIVGFYSDKEACCCDWGIY